VESAGTPETTHRGGGDIRITAPSEAEALAEALARLGVEREAIEFEVQTEADEDLLPGAQPQIELRAWIRPEYMAERAESRLRGMLDCFGLEYSLEVSIRERMIRMEILAGKQSSLLIGRNGQNLEALQYLVNRMVMKCGREAPMIFIDVEGYLQRQYRDLEELVRRAVERARESGNEIELDPMPSATRKYLHHFLRRYDGVTTFSRGEEPERYLVIIAD